MVSYLLRKLTLGVREREPGWLAGPCCRPVCESREELTVWTRGRACGTEDWCWWGQTRQVQNTAVETWENLIEERQQCAAGAEEDPGEEVCGVGNRQRERPICQLRHPEEKDHCGGCRHRGGQSLCPSPGGSFCAPPENPSSSQH